MGYRHVPPCTIRNDKSFECCWETFGVFPDKALCRSCRFFLVSLLLFMCNVYMRVHAFMHMSKPGVDTGCVWDRVSNWTWYSSIARLASKQAPETCLPAPTPELWLQTYGSRVLHAYPTLEPWLQTYDTMHSYFLWVLRIWTHSRDFIHQAVVQPLSVSPLGTVSAVSE